MAEERVQRRLSAILAADVVGYSRQMEADEAGTLERLKAVRREVFVPTITQFGGRVFKLTGDGAFVEFGSAVDAVNSAVAIQKSLTTKNASAPEDQRVELRIGISLGDVIVEGRDLYGNGVNIAARLEGLAEPGEICISENVHEHTRNEAGLVFTDLGDQQVKNIDRPIRAYQINRTDSDNTHTRDAGAPSLPAKPSIAVLPFDNMSGDPEQEYFADGIAEDIITGLSKFHWFFVIARNSSFAYKGKSPDIRKVAKELGVQYVLEGSVRRGGNRIRITAQLIDAISGLHIWADRFDRNLEDIFEVQDEITAAIVGEVAPSFISAEAQRVESKATDSLDSWDYAMRGNWFLSRRSITDLTKAKEIFEKALELDPKNTVALGGLTNTIGWLINFGAAGNIDEAREQGYAAARRALELAGNDAGAHLALGQISFYKHELDTAVAACRRALQLNSNLALAEGWLGCILSWRGDYDEAIEHAKMAERLSPHDPIFSMASFAYTGAEFGAGRYEKAIEWAKKTVEATPDFPAPWRYLAASLAHLGRMEEAKAAKEQLLRVMPHENLRLVRAALPSVDEDRMGRFEDGLRKAGVPE
jgi:adenylate cyclase